jgi:hypothetical protein
LEAHFQAGHGLTATTLAVYSGEPCFFLGEYNYPSADGRRKERYQMLKIVRNDRLVTAYIYLGQAGEFLNSGFTMLGGVVDESGRGRAFHTVEELQGGAVELRARQDVAVEPSDLRGAWRNQIEENGKQAKHLSTFAPGGNLVRA